MAPGYLIDLCQPVASIDGRGHVRSAAGSTGQDDNQWKLCFSDMPVHLLGTLCRKLPNAVHAVYLLSDVFQNIFILVFFA